MTACVAFWSSGPCSGCGHILICHAEGGCHLAGCDCAAYSAVVCGIDLVENPAGACAEWDGDYRCRDSAESHCLATDPYELHLCHADMVHHAFRAPFAHSSEPRWDHRIAFPPPAVTKEPRIIGPITTLRSALPPDARPRKETTCVHCGDVLVEGPSATGWQHRDKVAGHWPDPIPTPAPPDDTKADRAGSPQGGH